VILNKLFQKNRHFFVLSFLLVISFQGHGFGFSHIKGEEHFDIQSGSLMGLLHVSYVNEYDNQHSVLVGLGYVPKLSNHKEMLLHSLRYRYDFAKTWQVKDMILNPLSLGVGLLVSSHDDLFLDLPAQYPDGYYAPSAMRIIFNYQATLQIRPHFQAYFDVSVLDVGLISYIREPDFFYDNYDYLGLEGITNWGVGVRYGF